MHQNFPDKQWEHFSVKGEKNQLSQEKLCIELELHSCDISRSAYQKYEAGKLNIPIRVLIQLKKIYECTYEDFFANLDPNKNTS
ncbi:XRE family transcriptional regulator [bacterium 1XD42-8]|nr:XRE family transcriptional regulator [bacterium 1XD42-8]